MRANQITIWINWVTIQTAEFFTPNVIDFDKLQNGKGLIEYAGTYTEGEFTIDSTYFEPGQQYVIFWVYKQFDTWYSRKSEVISQIIPGPVPIKPKCHLLNYCR